LWRGSPFFRLPNSIDAALAAARWRTQIKNSRHIYAILRTDMDIGAAAPVAIER
jgi:hypothetical protein